MNSIIHSGALKHMTGQVFLLNQSRNVKGAYPIRTPGGKVTHATKIGDVYLSLDFILHDVLYVPNFKRNFIYVGKLSLSLQCSLMLFSSRSSLEEIDWNGYLQEKVYYLGQMCTYSAFSVVKGLNIDIWHR